MIREKRNITNHAAIHNAWPETYNIFGSGVDAEMEVANDGVFPGQSEIDTKVTAFEAKTVIMKKIIAFEAEVTPRRLRDSILTSDGKTWLTNKEAEVAAERSKL